MHLISFYSQFYQQFNHQNFEELISKQDLTLEDLLEFDDITQELANQDHRLIQFLTVDQVQKIISYATKIQEIQGNIKKAYKYPVVAADLLSEAGNALKSTFQEHPELMIQLFDCVTTTDQINPVIAGFFQRIITKHLQHNAVVLLNFLFQEDTPYVDSLIANIHNPSIVQTVYEILSLDIVKNLELDYLNQRKRFIDKLFDCVLDQSNKERSKGAASALNALLNYIISGEQNMNQNLQADSLMSDFYKSPKLEQIISKCDETFKIGIEFITSSIEIAAIKSSDYQYSQEAQEYIQKLSSLIFVKSEQILKVPQDRMIKIQSGSTISTLGADKYKIVLQIKRLTQIQMPIINKQILESQLIDVLSTDLIIQYQQNSFLHVALIQIIHNLLKLNSETSKALMQLLPGSILKASKVDTLKGLCISLVNKIIEFQTEAHNQLLQSNQEYQQFVQTTLQSANKLYSEKPMRQDQYHQPQYGDINNQQYSPYDQNQDNQQIEESKEELQDFKEEEEENHKISNQIEEQQPNQTENPEEQLKIYISKFEPTKEIQQETQVQIQQEFYRDLFWKIQQDIEIDEL